uniref:ABC transporter domain-containing protein n=1 Tax=Solanum lycopersicum TaxID=4081 RepID=A0A3Q7GI54_SOLLC
MEQHALFDMNLEHLKPLFYSSADTFFILIRLSSEFGVYNCREETMVGAILFYNKKLYLPFQAYVMGWFREIILVEFDFGGNEANQRICVPRWFYSICSAGTVRDNILFGREYDPRRSLSLHFDKTIRICLDKFQLHRVVSSQFCIFKVPILLVKLNVLGDDILFIEESLFNSIFLDFDGNRYSEVLRACSLDFDISRMMGGDMAFVGEKGFNLSGGQRARLALARAVYHDAEIYLLDDIVSAVDAHVGSSILQNAILGPPMNQQTRILCTHNIQVSIDRLPFSARSNRSFLRFLNILLNSFIICLFSNKKC